MPSWTLAGKFQSNQDYIDLTGKVPVVDNIWIGFLSLNDYLNDFASVTDVTELGETVRPANVFSC